MSRIKDLERSIEVIAGQIAAQQMLMETIIMGHFAPRCRFIT